MTKLWLTYAWVNNEDQEVDLVVQRLMQRGIKVRIDRTHLTTGKLLWPQIDEGIMKPDQCDAWAIYVTKQSLESGRCREELNYALIRALDGRGTNFPLIGIFPEEIEKELIPTALRSRIYVSLDDDDWIERVVSGAKGELPQIQSTPIENFKIEWSDITGRGDMLALYVRPRIGSWYPFVLAVPPAERQKLQQVGIGNEGQGTFSMMTSHRQGVTCPNGFMGMQIADKIDSKRPACALFNALPSEIFFGQPHGETYQLACRPTR